MSDVSGKQRTWLLVFVLLVVPIVLVIAGFLIATSNRALDFELHVLTLNGSAQEVRLDGVLMGVTPLVALSLGPSELEEDTLWSPRSDATWPPELPDGYTSSGGSTSVSGRRRVECQRFESGASNEMVWAVRLVDGERELRRVLRVEVGPVSAPWESIGGGSHTRSGIFSERHTERLEFHLP